MPGRVKTEGKFITLHKDTFHAEDFEDGQMAIYVDLKTIPRDGDRDHLIVQTVYQTIEVEVIYQRRKKVKEKRKKSLDKRNFMNYTLIFAVEGSAWSSLLNVQDLYLIRCQIIR